MEATVIVSMYLIRDSKADGFLSDPIMAPTPGMAERRFVDLLRDSQFFNKHAGDFSLWLVGTVDVDSGQVLGSSPVEILTGPTVLQLIKEA
jgi:hypothetical protein